MKTHNLPYHKVIFLVLEVGLTTLLMQKLDHKIEFAMKGPNQAHGTAPPEEPVKQHSLYFSGQIDADTQ